MRVTCDVVTLDVPPGDSGSLPLTVVNTSNVIESVTVSVVGIDPALLSSEPASLPLFPDATGELTVTVALPDAYPAGRYPVTLVVLGVAPGAVPAHHELELVVPERPAVRLEAAPRIVRTRGRATFRVTAHNEGNLPLELALRAEDTDRALRTSLTPSTLNVPVGGEAVSVVTVKGPRQLMGSDRDRPLTVKARAHGAEDEILLTLKQRSAIGRGLVTIIVLLAIIAIWALAFLLGVRQVLGADPFTKVAPASFFAGQPAAAGTDGAVPGEGGAVNASAPEGAMPKDGAVAAAVGATLTGTVAGTLDHQGVGRITVDVLRRTREGLVVVSSTATQTDGSYTVAGLFPGTYLVRASADGYDTVWYPGRTSAKRATGVPARARSVTPDVDLAVEGDPASLRGTVTTGDASQPASVTVTARPTWPGATADDTRTTTAGADGAYSFSDLQAPASYELTFVADGYQPATRTERVLGGQDRYALDVALGSGAGSIAGTVTDGANPVGGVTVSTTVGGKTFSVGTPTVGLVGQFALPNLPTPATYVLTFTRTGFTTRTVVVDLTAGEARSGLKVRLRGGAGTVTGKVVDDGGQPLGGVTVTVGGGASAVTTTTLTNGDVGTYTLTGLTSPGQYTLSFSLDGYTTASTPVSLTARRPSGTADVTMRPALGTITGNVTADGDGVSGVDVEVTDGTEVHRTTSAKSGGGKGSYSVGGLPPGTYTVTARRDGTVLATGVVTVAAGGTATCDLPVDGGS